MSTKFLILIFGILIFLILAIFFYYTKPLSLESIKKIAGDSTHYPQLKESDLKSPPKPAENLVQPSVLAKSVILIDPESGYVLYKKNELEKIPIASTTKIMTAIVILEDHPDKLKDVVTITYPMIAVEGSDIKLQVGEKITVENLLKGLLIMSGNDTAYALATYFGGKDSFVQEMNNKAKKIGMLNTNYKDPSGLDDEGSSTANDLSVAGAYAMRLPLFKEIVKTQEATIASVDGRFVHELKTSNHLLKTDDPYYYPNAFGIKTGFTYAAGHCLVSAAQKDNHILFGVILNTYEDTIYASAKESRKLLEWGFNNWSWE